MSFTDSGDSEFWLCGLMRWMSMELMWFSLYECLVLVWMIRKVGFRDLPVVFCIVFGSWEELARFVFGCCRILDEVFCHVLDHEIQQRGFLSGVKVI